MSNNGISDEIWEHLKKDAKPPNYDIPEGMYLDIDHKHEVIRFRPIKKQRKCCCFLLPCK